jgi:hypothetical protein
MNALLSIYHNLNRVLSKNRADLLLVFALALVTGLTTFYRSQLVDPILYTMPVIDVFFDGDIPPIFDAFTNPAADFSNKSVHPLLPSFVYLLGLPSHLLRLNDIISARTIISVIAAYTISIFFIILRLLSYSRLDAGLFSMLAATTAAAQFWFAVPEHYGLGAATMLSALCLVAVAVYHQVPLFWYLVVNLMTLGVTITNWMVGIIATIATQSWQKAVRIFVLTLVMFAGLASIQKIFFPTAALKAIVGTGAQMEYVSFPPTDLLARYQVFFFHSVVMPAIGTIKNWHTSSDWPYLMTVQHSLVGSGSVYGIAATAAWGALLGLGTWAFFSINQYPQLRFTLGLTLLGQFALHTFHGQETFLYSLHYALLLVMVASLVTLTKMRKVGIVLVVIAIVTVGINNFLQFHSAMEMVQQWKSQLPENFPATR